MATVSKTITRFDTGISASSKGPGANFNKNLDIFSDANSASLNPILVKVSASTVVGLCKWMVQGTPYSTDKYAYDDAGNIYKITSGEVWTVDRAGATIANGAAGQGLVVLSDYLYYPTATTIGRNGPLSVTPAYADDFLSDGVTDLDLVPTGTVTGQTYGLAASLSEAAINTLSITPTKDPLKSIQFYVSAKGTGNWTVVVHDSANTLLGTVTVANASLTNSQYNTFTITSPVAINIGTTYHVHVYSSIADGTLRSGTSNDLSTADYKTFFGILISDVNYHPAIVATNGVEGTALFGNTHYIAELAPGSGSYDPNRVVLEPGFSVRSFFKENEFWVAECWKGTTIDGSEEGRLYYWNGIDPYYSYSKPITSGLPNASVNFKNRVLSILGSKGTITIGTEPFLFIQDVPKLARGKKIEVLPGAMDVWQNKAVIGIGANTDDSTGVYQGVYEYGSASDRDSSEVLNFGYTISTGDIQGTTMKIGCVKAFGKDLYVSWKSEAGTYGFDKATKTGNPAATGSWESEIIDDAQPGKSATQREKNALRLVVTYELLPVGCTVTPKYKIDRAAAFVSTGFQGGIAATRKAWIEINTRYHEIEVGFDLVATTSYPVITSIYFEYDDLREERGDS